MAPIILVLGGTGAQGLPVIRHLTQDGAYRVRVLTRDPENARAKTLVETGHVDLIQGDATNENDLQKAFAGVDMAYVNLDGFVIGEKNEVYWGMRIFEIAQQHHVKHCECSAIRDANISD